MAEMVTAQSTLARAAKATREIMEMIRFEHTVFALPFALIGMLLAADGLPAPRIFLWILVAMVSARSAAMAFNRIADRDIDALNPRTASRAIPAGRIRAAVAGLLVVAASALFFLAAYELNPLALRLSPVALAVMLSYSYSKRFTWLSHVWLGVATGIAPTGAWIAVTGQFSFIPVWFTGVVVAWMAGFDILYSLADERFDREHGLQALPSRFGAATALLISRLLHVLSIGFLIGAGFAAGLGLVYYVGVGLCGLALAYEQSLVKPTDLSRLNTAFFTVNGFVSIGLLVFVAADWAVRRAL